MVDADTKYYTDFHSLNGAPTSRPEMPEKHTERVVRLSESKDDRRYAMGSRRRGKAVIFNHREFDPATKVGPRLGTDVDQKNLEHVLSDLEFDVIVKVDLTASEISDTINELASEDHSNEDCLMVVVLTHGGEGGKLHAWDRFYFLDELWKPFNAHNCPSLIGKPKIFIVQGCSGRKVDEGVDIQCDGPRSRKPKIDQSYSIPSECDFLIARSSYEEFVSYRNIKYGTLYISNLCEVLDRHGKNLHLLKILTKTARKVMFCEKVQMPCFVSNLTREVFFMPKNP